jgi:hypothetical protein
MAGIRDRRLFQAADLFEAFSSERRIDVLGKWSRDGLLTNKSTAST